MFTKILNYILIALAIASLISSYTWDYNEGDNFIGGTLVISLFGVWLVKHVRSFVIKDFKEIGTMLFGSENIVIEINGNKETYEISKVELINVYYYGYEGDSYPISLNKGFANLRQKQGDKNKIEIQLKNELLSYEFYLNKLIERNKLFKIVKIYKKNGVQLIFSNASGDNNIYKKI